MAQTHWSSGLPTALRKEHSPDRPVGRTSSLHPPHTLWARNVRLNPDGLATDVIATPKNLQFGKTLQTDRQARSDEPAALYIITE